MQFVWQPEFLDDEFSNMENPYLLAHFLDNHYSAPADLTVDTWAATFKGVDYE